MKSGDLSDSQTTFLAQMAQRYIWWKSPDDSLRSPRRIILQVMELASVEDGSALFDLFEKDDLRKILETADRGTLSDQSWSYWHYKLGHPADRPLPSLPEARGALCTGTAVNREEKNDGINPAAPAAG